MVRADGSGSLPACDVEELQRRLYGEYRVQVPVMEWNGRQFVRVSVQGYNVPADVEALVSALHAALPQAIASP